MTQGGGVSDVELLKYYLEGLGTSISQGALYMVPLLPPAVISGALAVPCGSILDFRSYMAIFELFQLQFLPLFSFSRDLRLCRLPLSLSLAICFLFASTWEQREEL